VLYKNALRFITVVTLTHFCVTQDRDVSIPVAALSKAWVCDHSLAGIVGSNPAGGLDVCLLRALRVVR
jgi:hypothetical protein